MKNEIPAFKELVVTSFSLLPKGHCTFFSLCLECSALSFNVLEKMEHAVK